ncbi:DUF5690 family protein [Paraflavitalea speifideaquila]|uniref:DUF5690 family protein n=1 Tax=Paraflavitalea speifideaquila TaxID=3076558 RepID=UPI00331300D1
MLFGNHLLPAPTVASFCGIFIIRAFLLSPQVLGYMVSKFIGIKIISELKPAQRKN